MENEISDVDESEYPKVTDKPRNRKHSKKKIEAAKHRRLSSHFSGPDCSCSRLQCFKIINHDERDNLVMQFNTDYRTKDEQDSYLCTLITTARKSPTPFRVIECEQQHFKDYSEFLKPLFKAKCPFATRPIREMLFDTNHPQLIKHRNNWHGAWETTAITNKRKLAVPGIKCSYDSPVPIKKEKFADLQVLKRFCKESARDYFENLIHE